MIDQKSYELHERRLFLKQIAEVEALPRQERKENGIEFAKDLQENPQLVAERIGWLLSGSYGKGSYDAAREVIGNSRLNREAWLTQTIAALEWHTTANQAREAWKSLSLEAREEFNELVKSEIEYALDPDNN